MKLSVIIVNYNSWEDTFDLVHQALASTSVHDGHCEILVVDNRSNTASALPRIKHPALHWIDRSENGGFSAGVNEGARIATGDWLLLLNPDIKLEPNTLDLALQLVASYNDTTETRTGMVGCQLLNPDGSHQPSAGAFPSFVRIAKELFIPQNRRRYLQVEPGTSTHCDWVTGAFMLIRKQTFMDVNGFDEDYFLYFEETDFCHRAAKAGWLCIYDPTIRVCHKNPLQNRTTPPPIRAYTRHSRMLYFLKNRPLWEAKLMACAIWTESIIRGFTKRLKGDIAYANAWSAIRSMAAGFVKGRFAAGTAVRDLVMVSIHKK